VPQLPPPPPQPPPPPVETKEFLMWKYALHPPMFPPHLLPGYVPPYVPPEPQAAPPVTNALPATVARAFIIRRNTIRRTGRRSTKPRVKTRRTHPTL
jgi:hypothetical protein